jgi:glycosyltransferase involved in cell wall biosynthesis
VTRTRLLLVGRGPIAWPLSRLDALRLDAIARACDVRLLAAAKTEAIDDGRVHLLPARGGRLEGVLFHLLLPLRVARELRSFRPDAVLVQGAHETEAVLLARWTSRSGARVILDLHGDWRAAPRLYGSRLRRLLAPLSDAIARHAVRHADAVRTVSRFTTELVRDLGREPAAEFAAFMDARPFLATPPVESPREPRVLFVGVLERYKNVDGLAAAWPLVAARIPGARLHIVGRGSFTAPVRALLQECPGSVTWTPLLQAEEIAAELDRSAVLVLPSRSEGMGRVLVEAFARARPVVAADVGGIRDVVEHEVSGLLVDPTDPASIGEALVRVLEDGELADRLGRAGHERVGVWLVEPDEYARRIAQLLRSALGPTLAP